MMCRCGSAYGASRFLRCVPDLVEFTLGPRAVWTRGLARDMSLTYSVAEKPVAFTIFAQRSNC